MVVKPSIAGHGFEVGDMVWAKMKSQPWLPGHVYNEEFATPLVRRSKREGLLLVAFFGANSYAWFDPSELLPFDSNYAEMSLQSDSKSFVKAVEDAIREVNRRIDLGLSCMCGNNKQNFREIDVQSFVSVDDMIEKARVSFQPKLTFDFLRELALENTVNEDDDINFIKNKATVMSYRKAVFKDFDQAFGYDPVRSSILEPSKAPLSGIEAKSTANLKDHDKKDDSKEVKEEKVNVTSSQIPVPIISAGEPSTACVEMSSRIVRSSKKTSNGNHKTEVTRVLDDLLSLAVDPFNIINRGSRINAKKAFLKFRSLVFQKGRNFSLQLTSDEPSASILSSEDSVELKTVNPQDGLKRDPSVRLEEKAAAKRKKISDIRNLTKEKKLTKKIDEPPAPVQAAASKLQSEDRVEVPPVKLEGEMKLKRGPSDHPEENDMVVVKRKKVGDINNLTKEKKVTKKIDEPPTRDMKKPEPELIKKTEQPTMLMIKFPKGGSLPSFKELKARFACYGPMDHSGTHIFWNTFSCQVVFRYASHAQAAYRSVVESNILFGNKGVKCTLKSVRVVGSAQPEPPVKVVKEDRSQMSMVPVTSGVEPKSILKKSSGEEASVKGRVKFMLGQVKNNMENKSCDVTTDFSNKFQKAVEPSVVSCTRDPSPPSSHYGTRHIEPPSLPPCSMRPPLMTPNKDIGQQMLSLLTRCNDVVTNVSSILGYSPYHPL